MRIKDRKTRLLPLLFLSGVAIAGAEPALAEPAQPAEAGPDAITAAGDDRLREAVRSRLGDDPDVKIHDLEVAVQDGIVTLYGRVADPADKHIAARYVDDIVGVKGVVNVLEVVPALQRQTVPEAESR